jgi:hypothetical protein
MGSTHIPTKRPCELSDGDRWATSGREYIPCGGWGDSRMRGISSGVDIEASVHIM